MIRISAGFIVLEGPFLLYQMSGHLVPKEMRSKSEQNFPIGPTNLRKMCGRNKKYKPLQSQLNQGRVRNNGEWPLFQFHNQISKGCQAQDKHCLDSGK